MRVVFLLPGSAIQWLRDKLKFFKNSKATNNLYLQANKKDELIIIPALTGLGAPALAT